MTEPAKLSDAKPRLYHAPSSCYSMIARLALAEGSIDHESVFVDIHFRLSQQQPDYVRLNPYGVADVVWTAFLARMEFAGLGAESPKRPALARYWRAMQTRASFSAADIWTKFHALRLIGGILGIARG